MKHTDIENIMSAKVAEYIAKGYILSTVTMSGHQGEIAKVDVKKNGEIIRIMLNGESSWDDEGTIQKTTLTIGRAIKKVRSHSPFDTMANTIWNNELEVIEEMVWYSVDSSADYFSEDKAEIVAQHKLQMKRWRVRSAMREASVKEQVENEAAKQVALAYVRKQPRCGRVKMADIQKVVKFYSCEYSRMHYAITLYNGKTFKIA